MESKAYRIYVPISKKVVISPDVRFVDDTHTEQKHPLTKSKRITTGTEDDVEKESNSETFVEINSFNDELETEELPEDNLTVRDVLTDDDSLVTSDIDQLTGDDKSTPLRRSDRVKKGIPPRRLIEELNIVINGEPSNYNEAISCQEKDNWMLAMEEEIESLIKNKTWTLVNLPKDKNLIGCKWVYKLKTDINGKVKKFKARLVAQGFNQKFGVDYDQVFAPVAKHSTFRILLSVAASRDMAVYHFDAKTAFLNGELQEEIYMRQPPGYAIEGAEEKVCLLNKSIYGLKQSARVWNETLHNVLINAKLVQSKTDNCLYTYHGPHRNLYILIYVDDILVASESTTAIQRIEKVLKANFNIEDLGLVANYLSIRVTKSKGFFLLDQEKYIWNVAAKFELDKAKNCDIPLSPSYHSNPDNEKLPNNDKYRAAIGCLLYICYTLFIHFN